MSTFIPDDAIPVPIPAAIEIRHKGELISVEIKPDDLDVRVFDYMPLNVKRLAGSDFNMTVSDRAFRAGITLWCRSWHQVPAGSLPGSEAQLAHMAGYGQDLRKFRAIRKEAMHGFKIAQDGRYYHAIIVEYALDALRKIMTNRYNGRAGSKSVKPLENINTTPGGGQAAAQAAGGAAAQAAAPPSKGKEIEENSKKESRDRTDPKAPPEPADEPSDAKPGKATRLALDWTPSPDLFAMATELGFAPAQIEAVADSFRDHWAAKPGRDGTKLDWDATFRNWIRKEDPKRVRGKPSASPAEFTPGGKPSVDDFHWRLRLKGFRDKSFWLGAWGPKPNEPICAAPGHILIEFEYRNADGSIRQPDHAEQLSH